MEYVYHDVVRDYILDLIPADGAVIGSIGCGWGRTEQVLVERGRQVHGVDISEEAVAVAKTRLTTARVIAPDDARPFAPGSLDGLILADVIEHLPLAWDRLADYAEMVRPGGWVVISVPNMRHVEVLARLAVGGDWVEDAVGIYDRTHVQFMTHRRLTRWCTRAGLRVDRWSDNYDYRFVRRNVYRTLNLATARLFRSFFVFEILALCRKDAPGPP